MRKKVKIKKSQYKEVTGTTGILHTRLTWKWMLGKEEGQKLLSQLGSHSEHAESTNK